MNKFLKSGLSLVLALTIVLSSALVGLGEIDFSGIFAVKASAASESDLTFTLNNDGKSYSVTDCNDSASGNLVIPSTYYSLPVTSIGEEVFYDCTSLNSISIPSSVISIGDGAFYGCTSLAIVTIPNNVKSIGNNAFCGCESLTSINVNTNSKYYSSVNGVLFNKDKTVLIRYPEGKVNNEYIIPASVTNISDSAFLGCDCLTSITIPDSVTSIGSGAFAYCTSLTSVSIPNFVTSIGDFAFEYCSTLTSITIPDSVTSIGDFAFVFCESLAYITIPNSVTSIGDSAFAFCTSLTSIIIPDSVTSIGSEAFYNCERLNSVTIPNSVTSIGDYAFSCCSSLTSVTIPNSVTSIGKSAFYNCKSLTSINVEENNKYYSSVNGVLFNKNKTVLIQYPTGKTDIEYVIPNSVTSIGGSALYGCSNLTSVTIPDSVTSIEDSAFENCSELTKVYYHGTSVQWGKISIGLCNTKLKDATKYYYLDGYGFCSIFGSCGDNISYFIEENGTLVITGEGAMIDYFSEGDSPFYNKTNIKSVIVEDGVTSIGDYVFNGCTSLTSVTIPDSVTKIGYYAFYGCTGLTAITIPDSVTSIDAGAFRDCTSLTSITIPDSVTNIDGYAFCGCTSLKSVVIPNSVASIGELAFCNCSRLASVIIGDGVISIGSLAFEYTAYYNNESNWIDEVLYIGNYLIKAETTANCDYVVKNGTKIIADYAFSNCSVLTAITIPDSVTSIGNYAFYNCESLTDITIGNGVTSIGDSALGYYYDYYLDKLKKVNGFTIKGHNGSVAKSYARQEGFTFISTCISSSWIIDSNSTCIATGTKHKECTVCGEVLETEAIPKLEHTSSDWITDKEATCTAAGLKHKECVVCGEVLETGTVAKTGHKSSDWIVDKKATVYSDGSKHKECTVCGDVLEKATIPQLKCSTPKLTKIENASSGIKITWGKTAGADSYNIYRKTYSNGKWSGWSTIKTGATGTTYTDTTAKSGVYYIYTVRAKNEAGLSGFNSAGLKIKFLATPKLSSVANGSGKVTVKWSKVTGASSYTVYRKTYSNGKWSGWSKIGTTKNAYYNDTKVSSGKYYKYTVRATSGDYTSYYNTSGLQIKYLAGPKISSASSRRDGILINWNKIPGASGYYVYRKAPSGDWKKIATVKGNTKIKYLDETPRKGVTYQYCVKAYSGNYTSTYANTYKIKCNY